jgi:hypothetical protein
MAHVVHHYGMSLVWGNDPAIDPLIEHLRAGDYRKEDEWLQIDPRWASMNWDELLGAAPYDFNAAVVGSQVQRFNRVNFRFDKKLFLARPERSPIPQGWSLRPANARDFELTGMGVAPRAFWRDARQFIAKGGGVVPSRTERSARSPSRRFGSTANWKSGSKHGRRFAAWGWRVPSPSRSLKGAWPMDWNQSGPAAGKMPLRTC